MECGIESTSDEVFQSPSDLFKEHFPYYLAIGMTYDEFWHGDMELVRYYRKADEIRKERENQRAWLQGAYIYEALCNVSPILRAFSNATKPVPYPDRPYALTQKEQEYRAKEAEKQEHQRTIEEFKSFVEGFNKSFQEKQEVENE